MTSQDILVNLYETIKEQEREEKSSQSEKNIEEFHDKSNTIALPTTSSDYVETKSVPEVNYINIKLDPDGECLPLLDRHDIHFNQFPGTFSYYCLFIFYL